MKVLLVLAALIVLFVVACDADVDFYGFTTPGEPPGRAEASPVVAAETPAVADVLAVASATTSTGADETAAEVYSVLAEATASTSATGAKLIRAHIPRLVGDLRRELGIVRAQVAAVGVETKVGWKCRETVLTMLRQQERLFGSLAVGVGRAREPWTAVTRFTGAQSALSRRYGTGIDRCSAGASGAEREVIARVMRSL